MRVVICEDEASFRQSAADMVARWADVNAHPEVSCSAFASSEDLLEQWKKGMAVDLLFLDIQIPGEMDGMALAQQIRAADQNVEIVFITNYEHYVYEGYTVSALRYLRKPVQSADVYACLDIAYRRRSLLSRNSILIDARDQKLVVQYAQIIYIEARLHYLHFRLTEAGQAPQLRAKLSDVAPRLSQELFVQCHRSYIVNLQHIRRFTKTAVFLSNAEQLPVSQSYFAGLSAAFNSYYREVQL